ncbi:hypothetical protein DV737_g5315, partial [Chaetothyriales sp. CBS 132003]
MMALATPSPWLAVADAELSSIHATFTPTQLKYQPRAWQRKPATPAAARSQHQSRKIWKRVPLQNIASNVNAAWEKGGKVGDGIMRPVKKIRENAIVGITAKWDHEPSPLQTPRRRRPQNWLNVEVTNTLAMTDDEQIAQASVSSPISRNSLANGCSDLTCNPDDGIVTPQSPSLQSSPQSPSLQSSPSPALELDIGRTDADSHSTVDSRLDPPSVSTAVDSMLREGATQLSPSLHRPYTANSDLPTHALADEGMLDLSPPEEGQAETVTSTPPPAQASQPTEHSNHPHPEDQDDTAYLQAFLSRSRAQRDASAQFAQASNSTLLHPAPVSSDLPTLASNPSPPEQTASKQIAVLFKVTDLPPDSVNGDSSQGNPEMADADASSPCRRSSRLTRIPRVHKLTTLPNTIALRRLNGTEFVAVQKEARTIATATRANTKRNKGCAMSVRQRLIQLHAEKHDPVDEERQKNARGVVWSETIARMQGADGNEVPYEPDQRPEPDVDATTSDQDDQAGTNAELKSTLTPLRRRRKDNLGNVAGTPAPKATIGLLLSSASQEQEPEEQDDRQIEVPRPTPMKKKRTRTKT